MKDAPDQMELCFSSHVNSYISQRELHSIPALLTTQDSLIKFSYPPLKFLFLRYQNSVHLLVLPTEVLLKVMNKYLLLHEDVYVSSFTVDLVCQVAYKTKASRPDIVTHTCNPATQIKKRPYLKNN
jgi:hypothetical protein